MQASPKDLRDPTEPNVVAWLRVLRELTVRQRAARQEICSLIETYLVFLGRSTTVERWLGRIALTELKRRAHKIKVFRLGDALKLAIQNQVGRRLAQVVIVSHPSCVEKSVLS